LQSDLTDFNNILLERFELTNALEQSYRREHGLLGFKTASDLSNHNSFIKIDGINYNHPVFLLQGKFKVHEDSNSLNDSFGMGMGQGNGSHNNYDKMGNSSNHHRKSEFDIDALIEMTYNS
jgi:hypothetical protein